MPVWTLTPSRPAPDMGPQKPNHWLTSGPPYHGPRRCGPSGPPKLPGVTSHPSSVNSNGAGSSEEDRRSSGCPPPPRPGQAQGLHF